MPNYIYALHDPGGEHLFADAKGFIVFTEEIGANPDDKSGRDYRQWSEQGYGVIARLNNGYGSSGTIPTPDRYGDFAMRAANFIAASNGCKNWVIGNEPNHLQERPQGQLITADMYADCFRQVYDRVISVAGTSHALMPAPIAPWNLESGDWLVYHRTVWQALWQIAGGVALHAYTHGPSHHLITSEERVQGWHWHFRVYRDMLAEIPDGARGLPVYITESNQGDNAWVDANTQWVEAAYDEVDRWNGMEGTQKIFCLALYRWPKLDKWAIVDKPGVHADMRAAVARKFRVPSASTSQGETIFMPQIGSGPQPAGAPDVPRDIDPRLIQRGVTIEDATPDPANGFAWKLLSLRFFNEQESQGRHHIYVERVDEQGRPLSGMAFLVKGQGSETPGVTNDRRGFDAANVPMWASEGKNGYAILVNQGDTVRGLGMGDETPGGFNAGIHTSTLATYRRMNVAQPQPQPQPTQPAIVPLLLHPVADERFRQVSQVFGARPEYYRQFSVDGVPLRGHEGVDFATPIGTPVQAVADGKVVEAADQGNVGYGRYVKLVHDWGETVYAHLEGHRVWIGAEVTKGQVIGTTGNTGNSEGPHLHFGLRVNPFNRRDGWGGYVNPALFLPLIGIAPTPMPETLPTRSDIAPIIVQAAEEFGIEWQLLASLAWAESSFNPSVTSTTGAKGLTQIMPATWAEWSPRIFAGDDMFDPLQNARVGAVYLKWLLNQTQGNLYKALMAYAWGIGNVLSGIEPPDEAIAYSAKIVHGRDLLKAMER